MSDKTRRDFVREVTVLGFGGYLSVAAGACTKKETTAPAKAGEVPKFPKALRYLTPQQFLTAGAAAERLLPRDADPGALDLGVPEYIDRALANDELDSWLQPFLRGLEVIDQDAMQRHKKVFIHLAAAQQDEILKAWQTGEPGERHFFEMLLSLTFEGAFGDPTYGGNKEGKGFAMVGFYPPHPMPGMHLVKLPGKGT